MSTNDTPDEKSSGTTEQFAPETTIILATDNAANKDTFHTNAKCRALAGTPTTVEKQYRHRPLNSRECHYCRQRREANK